MGRPQPRVGAGDRGTCLVPWKWRRPSGQLCPRRHHTAATTPPRPCPQIKPFLKCVNYNHVMPTRYALDVELKSIVTTDVVSGSNPTARQNARKEVKKILEDKVLKVRTIKHVQRIRW